MTQSGRLEATRPDHPASNAERSIRAGRFGEALEEVELLLAAQPDFIEQIADTARGPQSRNEFVVLAFVRKSHLLAVFFGLATDGSFDHELIAGFAGVAPRHHELLALEKVGQRRRIHLGHPHAVGEIDLRIREDRVFDLRVKG